MNNSEEKSLSGNSVVNYGQHIGDNIQQNFYSRKNSAARINADSFLVEDLFEKKPQLNVFVRLLLALISAVLDYLVLYKSAEIENVNVVVVLLLVVVLSLIAFYLFYSAVQLLFDGRFRDLRRIGVSVISVKTRKCPICEARNHDGNLKLEYNSESNCYDGKGNYLVCSNDPKDHYWYVTFPKRRK